VFLLPFWFFPLILLAIFRREYLRGVFLRNAGFWVALWGVFGLCLTAGCGLVIWTVLLGWARRYNRDDMVDLEEAEDEGREDAGVFWEELF